MSHTTVGKYLVARLEQAGLKHVFGVPGDYVLRFYDELIASNMQVIGTCTEIGAGYAADAYARVNGLGCVCVTYCVGGLNVINAIAGAYAEKAPVVVLCGSPGVSERKRSSLVHHQVRDFHTQLEIYTKVTEAAVALEDAAEAPRLIDQTIATCLRTKRPVFIEIPRDMVDTPCAMPHALAPATPHSDAAALKEAVNEAAEMLRKAKRPAILAGVEIHRFGLQQSLVKLVEHSGFPVAATVLGKSVISEVHPQYAGVFSGAISPPGVRQTLEGADALLVLGAFMTDLNLGMWTAKLDESRTINADSQRVMIRHHQYQHIDLGHFIEGLCKTKLHNGPRPRKSVSKASSKPPAAAKPYRARPAKALTVKRAFQRINELLEESNVVICDVGDSMFSGTELVIRRRTEFLSPAYYASMGYAIPAALGAQIRDRKLRPIVFVGDGAFQMTCQELSTIARHGLHPIVFVLNNKGYTTERVIHDGPYNDIHNWGYHLWPGVLGAGWGCEVFTEGELEIALQQATDNRSSLSVINLHIDPMDHSQTLDRMGKRILPARPRK
ncbi:MAG: thiamine pyrophosphate-binding protein [Phycisphaeraceae bacterium]